MRHSRFISGKPDNCSFNPCKAAKNVASKPAGYSQWRQIENRKRDFRSRSVMTQPDERDQQKTHEPEGAAVVQSGTDRITSSHRCGICHAPWVLIDAGVARGRKLTSWEHIQTDVKNAGGNWINEEVVVENGLVTSRKPDDIPAFNKKMIEEFCEGKHARQTQFAGAGLET